jgi:hypothetical protein
MSLTRFLFATDLHGDMQDAGAVAALHEFTKAWKPSIRVFGGDLFDFRNLRRGASAEERSESMSMDVDAGLRFLTSFRPNYYLRGNHCERLWDLAVNGKGVEADYAQKGVRDIEARCAKMKCEVLPYHKRDGVLKIGHLKMLHGFYAGITATRQHGLTYGACLHGHTHTIDEASVAGLERRAARGVGALCKLDMPYNSRMPVTLRHAHGWAYGVINDKTGSYHVWQAEKIDDLWLLPSSIKSLAGPKR